MSFSISKNLEIVLNDPVLPVFCCCFFVVVFFYNIVSIKYDIPLLKLHRSTFKLIIQNYHLTI